LGNSYRGHPIRVPLDPQGSRGIPSVVGVVSDRCEAGGEGSLATPTTEDTLASEQEHQGRLELTWTNKDKRLLAHEDGSYEWLSPADYRVAEIRLLDDAGAVGNVEPKSGRARDNLLIRGDALNALTTLTELPEFASEYVGKIKLAYLDPPFNTQQSFLQYEDALEHSVWLTMMRDRLTQVKKLLSEDGSVWVHLDDSEMAYCKAMMDEIFGRDRFVGTVIWQRTTSARNDTSGFSKDQDYILVYAGQKFEPNGMPRSDASEKAYRNPDNDDRGPWREGDYKAGTGYTYPITHPRTGEEVYPPEGMFWRYPREAHERHIRDGLLWWGKTLRYSMPKMKRFRSQVGDTVVPQTLWLADEVDTTRRAKTHIKELFPSQVPFNTPKPERLMARIVHIGSNPGDVVLDCFLGSGTTPAVAHKMGRRWVGIERSSETLEAFTLPRLVRVVDGSDPGGVTGEVGWEGGGGFRVMDVAPSMFEATEGSVFIADWASNGKLAEATAAQLGFEFELDPPFTGRKGRSRLAVIDGLVNADVAKVLVSALPEDERLTLCGTAIDPDARAALREARPGSTVRKIPASILADYRSARWQPSANGHTE
jgi:adenine-specific DNA-methyltransferase